MMFVPNSRFNEEDQAELGGRNLDRGQMEEFFRTKGMHPSKAADVILSGVKRNKRRIFIGLDAKLIDLAQRITPMHYHRLLPLISLPLALLRNKKSLADLPEEPAV